VKFFQKLLVAPATAAIFMAPNLNGFAKESVKAGGDQEQINKDKNLIAQVATENEEADTLKISVTGTRSPRETKNVPASVTVINKNEIDNRGISDLRELFRYEPGVSIKSSSRNYWSDFGQNSINIRGMEDNRVLLQKDGINLPKRYDFSYSLGRADYVDLNALKSVEILKGPASSLYGSDAFGGVVNYRSLYPEDILDVGETFNIELPVNYDGSSEKIAGSTRIGFRDDDSGIEAVVVTTISEGEEVQVKADKKYIDDTDVSKKNLYTNIVKNIDDNSRFNFIYETVSTEKNTTKAPATLSSSYSSIIDDIEIDRWMGSIGYEYDNPGNEGIFNYAKVNIYVQDASYSDDAIIEYPTAVSRYTGALTPGKTVVNDYGLDDESKGFNIQFRTAKSTNNINHKLTYGVDYSTVFNSRPRKKTTTQSGTVTSTTIKDTPDADTSQYGVYLQDEISFDQAPKLELIAGLRYDSNDIDSHNDAAYQLQNDGVGAKNPPKDLNNRSINPSLALIYKLTPELSAYTKYSTAFRSPTYHELNVAWGNRQHGYYYLSNPDLEPETSDNYELGLKGDYSKFDFSLVGFLNNYQDLIEVDKVGEDPECVSISFYRSPCDISQAVNKDEAEIWGIEFSSEYNFNQNKEGFSVLTSMAYSYGDDTTSSNAEALTSIEPFKAILGLKYTGLANKWSAELTNTYVGDARTTKALANNPSEAYSVLDLFGNLNVTERLSVDLGLYNLNDTRYFNYSTVKSKSSSDSDINKWSEPGRNVKAGFKFIF
jgi:hemoglobin/transferrin/lactoferrin receptor protein